MNKSQFRAWLEAQVDAWRAANFPTLPVIYQNTEDPDPDKVGALWLDVSIKTDGGSDAAVGAGAPVRLTGVVKLMVYMRVGEGMQAGEAVLDSLLQHFRAHRRAGGGVVLGAPVPHEPPEALGWQKAGWFVPFRNDVA